ncbi:unnamed protein product [Knipowitschia caucasica]|uniref:Hexosyltransferase n=1 Tax=Knipowitschia caucasica TaxID=637954 RepID=A0AAV2KI41_KNICA
MERLLVEDKEVEDEEVEDEEVEDEEVVQRKPRKAPFRRILLALVFICIFCIVFGLNLTQSSSWRPQLWSQRNSSLSDPPFSLTDRPRTRTSTAPEGPLPAPEYKSPGPYLVEYPHKYPFLIEEPDRCKELDPFLVLVVPVAPHNVADRQIIRDTWGAPAVLSKKRTALFFLLGLGNPEDHALMEESEHHRDIVQSSFIDSYKNLTIKTMVMMEWLDAHCRHAAYAMKIDSDMFFNPSKLLEVLGDSRRVDFLSGLVERAATVHRYRSSKWYVPEEVFPESVYPPYVLGLGYVFSMDLPRKLLEASREVKALYIEDVYVGMCMRRLGLQPQDPPAPGAFHVFPPPYSRCGFSRIIATTLDTHTDRRQLWRDFSQTAPYCPRQT